MIHYQTLVPGSTRRSYSLSARLALITAIWSAIVLLATCLILAGLFRQHAEDSFDAELRAKLIHLIGTMTANGPEKLHHTMPAEQTLFDQPLSGWVWQIRRGDTIIAQSGSLGPPVEGVMEPLNAPDGHLADFVAPDGTPSRGLSRAVLLGDGSAPLTFALAGPRTSIDGNPLGFSTIVFVTLGLFGAAMFLGNLSLSRIALAPLDALKERVGEMRSGKQHAPERHWPREMLPVVDELEDLNAHVDAMIEQYRNEASDLAHALKTPLAIIGQIAEATSTHQSGQLTEQIRKITRTIDWHLTRRRLSVRRRVRVDVSEVAEDVRFAMSRLFKSRRVGIELDVDPGAHFVGSEEDLHEMLGNLVDNACKWAQCNVRIGCAVRDGALCLRVADDGPGIPESAKTEVLMRGARMDDASPGHGMGLAIVRDTVRHYGGTIAVRVSELGGACIELTFPHMVRSAQI